MNITNRNLFNHLSVSNSDAVITVPIILLQQFKAYCVLKVTLSTHGLYNRSWRTVL